MAAEPDNRDPGRLRGGLAKCLSDPRGESVIHGNTGRNPLILSFSQQARLGELAT